MKKILIILAINFFLINAGFAQSNAPNPNSKRDSLTYEAADSTLITKDANYPGGISNFYNYLGYSLAQNLPYGFRKLRAKGVVYIQFIVNKDGDLDDVKVLKGIEESCDNLALELVKNSGKWIPATQNGDPVASTLTLPIRFRQ